MSVFLNRRKLCHRSAMYRTEKRKLIYKEISAPVFAARDRTKISTMFFRSLSIISFVIYSMQKINRDKKAPRLLWRPKKYHMNRLMECLFIGVSVLFYRQVGIYINIFTTQYKDTKRHKKKKPKLPCLAYDLFGYDQLFAVGFLFGQKQLFSKFLYGQNQLSSAGFLFGHNQSYLQLVFCLDINQRFSWFRLDTASFSQPGFCFS